MQSPTLVLRDIHTPPAPPWWPPAPGWWLLAAAAALLVALYLWWRARRRRRQRAVEAVFDNALAAARTPADAVAAMSELLRRAARRLDPQADHLQGEAWLALLDRESGRRRGRSPRVATRPGRRKRRFGARRDPQFDAADNSSPGSRPDRLIGNPSDNPSGEPPAAPTGEFAAGPGRLLLDGGYRRDIDPQQVAELRTLARARFLQWMART